MTTDPIPEAVKVAGSLHQYEPTLTQLKEAITQACLAYHKRKLKEYAAPDSIINGILKLKPTEVSYLTQLEELLQLHTAQAVEEAVERATLCPECGGSGTVSEESGLRDVVCPRCSSSWQKKCESLQQALTTAEAVSHGFQEKAGELQKQCAEFQTLWDVLPEIENKYQDRLVIHLREKIEGLQKQCEELRQLSGKGRYCPRCQDWLLDPDPSLGDTCGSCFSPVEYKRIALLQWERFDLRTRVEKLEKAEAEVAELQANVEKCLKELSTVSKDKCNTIDQLTQLQQDVRPLVEYLTEFADRQDGAPDASPIDKEACNASEMIETFLAKHPELSP